jgi:hypothetical protein
MLDAHKVLSVEYLKVAIENIKGLILVLMQMRRWAISW